MTQFTKISWGLKEDRPELRVFVADFMGLSVMRVDVLEDQYIGNPTIHSNSHEDIFGNYPKNHMELSEKMHVIAKVIDARFPKSNSGKPRSSLEFIEMTKCEGVLWFENEDQMNEVLKIVSTNNSYTGTKNDNAL